MNLSKRLKAIYNYINKEDKVLDIGCDHGYLDIYLALNKKNKTIIASDISQEVIKATKKNIKDHNVTNLIKVYCTNGTKDIKEKYDTIVLAGLGSFTILDILNNSPVVNKLIICSNNNWENIRKEVTELGYTLNEETLLLDKSKLYCVMLFNKGNKKLSKREILVGKYNYKNKKLYSLYKDLVFDIYKKVPFKQIKKKLYYLKKIYYLNNYLRKKDRAI